MQGNASQRLPGLDVLRAIAILWVMLFHSWLVGGLGENYAWIERNGWMGVDLFFVLSGYLIGSQLLKPLSRGEPLNFGDFYLRRAFRVLPTFLVVLAVYVLWPSLRESPGLQPSWQFVTFTLNYLIDYVHNKAFSHAWSLCVEEHFYLVMPWLTRLLARKPSPSRFFVSCIVVLAAGMLIRGYVWQTQLAPVQDADDGRFDLRFLNDIYYPTHTRLDGLLAGVMLAAMRAFRPQMWARCQRYANPATVVGLAVLVASILLFRDRTGFVPSVVGYPLLSFGLALLVFAGADNHGWLGRLRIPGLGWIALTSYSLYLSHKLVFHAVQQALPPSWASHGWLSFATYAVAVFAVGAVLHYSVERPLLRLRERLGGLRKTAPATATALATDT